MNTDILTSEQTAFRQHLKRLFQLRHYETEARGRYHTNFARLTSVEAELRSLNNRRGQLSERLWQIQKDIELYQREIHALAGKKFSLDPMWMGAEAATVEASPFE